MPLDAICLTAVVEELKKTLVGGKIDKIHQPGRDEVLLAVRGNGENVKLLLSANPNHPRLQLTGVSRENPGTPPMFCMLLRKHLTGGRILSIHQPPMERVVEMTLEATDELGDRVERRLVLEAMGRHSNLILLDAEGRIMDCLRRVDADMSAKRQVLPGLFYHLPPPPEKRNPLELTVAEVQEILASHEGREPDKRLLDAFTGMSPLLAREVAFRAGGADADRLAVALTALLDEVRAGAFVPYLIRREEKPVDFTFLPILQYGPETESCRRASFSDLLDEFYETRENTERIRQRGQDLMKAVTSARDRAVRKIANQEKELEATLDRERLRELGDIVTSNLHVMEKGMRSLTALDFYDPDGGQVEIKLDPLLYPQQNAAKYYKEYNKAKTAEKMLTIQLEKARRELEYLNSVLESISLSEGERDLQETRQELTDTGYLRKAKTKGREKRVSGKPMEFRSTAGLRISVGKNNSQNDELTTKSAFKSDIWLHTQKIHGSHVILRTEGEAPDAESLTQAAMLAAWFSQGREGKKVPVDYTPVKFVKKPAGARPGMVVYTTYQTAYVDPDESLVKQLRAK